MFKNKLTIILVAGIFVFLFSTIGYNFYSVNKVAKKFYDQTIIGARTDSQWDDKLTYLQTSYPTGRNILINGSSKYLNWGTISGVSGYGFRDNSGTMEYKNSGGSWASIGSGGTSSVASFLDLTDTPSSYSGQTGLCTKVNATEDGLEYGSCTGTSTGLTATAFSASDNLDIATTSTTVDYGVATGYNIPLTASTTNWQTAYGWGNHAGLYPTYAYASSTYYLASNPNGYISSYTETDPVWLAASSSYLTISSAASTYPTYAYASSTYYLASNPNNYIDLTDLSSSATGLTYNNGTGAFSWTAGYEGLKTASTTEWNTAYSWGDWSSAIGSTIQGYSANLDSLAGLTPASAIIRGDGLGAWETVTQANFITDNSILTTDNTKTINNKTISGASNTITNIATSSITGVFDISGSTNLSASGGIQLNGDNIEPASGYSMLLTASATAWEAYKNILTTKGDILGYSTLATRLAVGSDGTCLTASSTAATGLAWGSCGSGSGTPGGNNTEIQYNNSGSFGGIGDITTDGTNLYFADDIKAIFGTGNDAEIFTNSSNDLQINSDSNEMIFNESLIFRDASGPFRIGVNDFIASDLIFFGMTGFGGSEEDILRLNTASDYARFYNADVRISDGRELRLYNTADTYYSGFKASSTLSASQIWTLPTADGSSGQYLKTNGSGTLSWDSPAGSGDVTAVGDCASGDCYDGTSDGGTYMRLWNGAYYSQLAFATSSANLSFLMPTGYGTNGQVLTTDGSGTLSWSTASGGLTTDQWVSVTGTRTASTTFTYSGSAGDEASILNSLVTCTDSGGSTRRVGYISNATESSGTITVTVVMDSDMASGDTNYKMAPHRKVTDYERLVTIPGEQVADASNAQGLFFLNTLEDSYLLPVDGAVGTACSDTGTGVTAFNIYDDGSALFGSAIDLVEATSTTANRPTTKSISAGSTVNLRITSIDCDTTVSADFQARLFIVPQTLYTTAN